ncbi:hypothetical protein [Streptomyces sp. NPDC004976]
MAGVGARGGVDSGGVVAATTGGGSGRLRSDVTEAPTWSSWPYQPSRTGRLMPLSASVTDPLSTRGGSDASGSGSSPPEPPSRPSGAREVVDPLSGPSSASAYTPTPMLASTATATATAIPFRTLCPRPGGGAAGYAG